jgi:hypothetical protein
MTKSSNPLTSKVFKIIIRDDQGEFSLNGEMLKVLIALDGEKNLAAVNQSLGMDLALLKDIITKLDKLQLVQEIKASPPVLNAEFMAFLKIQLSRAMGPIAHVIIEDEMQEFSDRTKQVPIHRAAELVDLLSRQIHREEKRMVFQQVMVKKINEIARG